MGFPVSLIANMYMDLYEEKLLEQQRASTLWRRYVDDTFIEQQIEHKENFIKHINSVDQSIKFTVEDTHPDGSLPFLDTYITPELTHKSVQETHPHKSEFT